MDNASLSAVLRQVRKLAGAQGSEGRSDSELLDAFLSRQDATAFAALVQRHGPMVLNVCHRVLHQREDAEDAFQATFLILARKAASVRKRPALASWLYGAASRMALSIKRAAARRRSHEGRARAMTPTNPCADLAWREVQVVLEEEIQKLAEKYRTVFVLCCLESKPRAEVARLLGLKEGTVSSRLDHARKHLQGRLARRGVTLSGVLAAAALTPTVGRAVPPALLATTVRGAAASAAGTAGAVSARVAALVAGGLRTTPTNTVVATLVLALALVAGGTGLILGQTSTTTPPDESLLQQPHTEPQEPAAQKQPRADRYGDALPSGALARIGTARWWRGKDWQGYPVVYAPDGRSLICGDRGTGVRILDAATGKELRHIERQGEPVSCFALSPDGKTIITGSRSSPLLRQWDVSTGKELRQIPTGDKETSVLAFAPNGKTLAAVTGQIVIRLWDVATWKETHQLRGHSAWIGWLAFSPDGKTLFSGGGITHAMRWWDVGTGQEVSRLDLKSEHNWETTLSPDGKRLAALVFPGAVLHLWDATTGGEIARTALGKEGGWSCLCFSPDSEILACAAGTGRWGNQTLFFAAATGRELRSWGDVSYTNRMAFSPDGKILAQAQRGVIRLRDAVTGKPLVRTPLPDYVLSVRFTPDERTLLTSCWGGQTGTWQPFSGEPRSVLNGPPEGFAGRADMILGTALSTDGKRAALVDVRGVLHVWDPATGKFWCRISEPPVGTDQADFSPDGKVLVVKHVDHVIRLWDTTTGKMRCSLPRFGTTRFPHPHAFSADGRVVATAPGSQDKSVIRLWDTGTGKELGELAWEDTTRPTCLAFSPTGKYLVAAHTSRDPLEPGGGSDGIGLRLWDLAARRELRRFHTPPAEIRTLAISPDGKTLAAGANDTVLLWELASGQARGRFPGHQEWVWSLAFSPSGRLLASGSWDHTALVWDVTGVCPDGQMLSLTPQPDEIGRLWTELGSSDGVRAYRALWMMVAAARPSVSFLAERLRPEQPVEDARLKRLIAELDSEQFQNRTWASQELEELGELAETALRKALAGTQSLEVRRRVDDLLHKVETRTLSPKQLLNLRALEVLEQIGTPEARRVLQDLAEGAPEARLTQEAKASLERLSRRP